MPNFFIFTNLPRSKIPDDFLSEASKFLAEMLNKPLKYVTVRIQPDEIMAVGGSTELCASTQVYSIYDLGLEENKIYSKKIAEFLQMKLGIDPARNGIVFTEPRAEYCGWYGKTFVDIEL